jgi:hypothetical protein
MKSDYKLKGQTVKVEIELEREVAEVIKAMEDHVKFSSSEISNTALKRFISQHKDFLPANYPIKF